MSSTLGRWLYRRTALLVSAVLATGSLVTTSLAAASLASTALAAPSGRPGPVSLPGAADLLATPGGVVWSWGAAGASNSIVLRSTDGGLHWRTALDVPALPNGFGLTASYFLGADDAWVIKQNLHGDGVGETTTVYGTSDGGGHWFHSKALPGDLTTCCLVLSFSDQIYFANPEDGWILGAGQVMNVGSPTTLSMLWWKTTDGGESWSQMPASDLPFQGRVLGGLSGCAPSSGPALTFATADIGWFTEGDCAIGVARPKVWWTGDGGERWSPASLPPPASGWGDWYRDNAEGGVDVGAARLFGPDTVVVPVALGRSSLVVERSTDGGRTWAIASQVELGVPSQAAELPGQSFQALSPQEWLVAMPTELAFTSDGGHRWTFVRSRLALHQPVYFTSLRHGFEQGSTFTVAWSTNDGGQDWSPEEMPSSLYTVSTVGAGPPVSMVQSVQHFVVAAGNAGIFVLSHGGKSWEHVLGPGYPVSSLDLVGTKVGFALSSGQLLRTTDGGITWEALLQPRLGVTLSVDFWSAEAGITETGAGFYVTYDAGTDWEPLGLPNGLRAGAMNGGSSPGAFCFSGDGTGWAAASSHGQLSVLLSTNGGRHWATSLAPADLPGASSRRNRATVLGAQVEMAACQGRSAWVLVEQPTSSGDAPGTPYTFDLLVTTDLGRSWRDVLQSQGSNVVSRPRVPSPPGGPAQATAGFDWPPESAVPGGTGTLWLTSYNSDFGGEAFASTGDGGAAWSQAYFPRPSSSHKYSIPTFGWQATVPFSADNAWALFFGPALKHRPETSVIYSTTDAGANWSRHMTFPWPSEDTPSGAGWGPARDEQGLVFTSAGTGFLASGPGLYGDASAPSEIQLTRDNGLTWATVWRRTDYRITWLGTAGSKVVAAGLSHGGLTPFLLEGNRAGTKWHVIGTSVSTNALPVGPQGGPPGSVLAQLWGTYRFYFVDGALGFATPDPMVGQGSFLPAELLRTTDGGRHWAPVPLPGGSPTGGLAFTTDKDGFATGTLGATDKTSSCRLSQIWATSDGGSTWHPVPGTCSPYLLTSLSFPTGSTGFAAGGQYLKFSGYGQELVMMETRDGGRRWATIYYRSVPGGQGPDINPFGQVHFFNSVDGLALDGGQTVGGNEAAGGHLWRTTDGGRQWSLLSVSGLRLVAEGAKEAWLVGGGLAQGGDVLWRSLNQGRTWSPVGNPANVTVSAVGGFGSRLWVSTEAGEFLSRDGGHTWHVQPAAMQAAEDATWSQVPVELAAGGTVLVGPGRPKGDGFWLSTNGGRTGRLGVVAQLASSGVAAIAFADPRHGLAISGSGSCSQPGAVLATDDGGATWHQVSSLFTSVQGLAYDATLAVVTGWSCGAYVAEVSTDAGKTWSEKNLSGLCGPVAADGRTMATFCADTMPGGQYLLVSHDGGGHWAMAARLPPSAGYSSVGGVAATSPSMLWATGPRGALWQSSDGGSHWRVVPLSLPLVP